MFLDLFSLPFTLTDLKVLKIWIRQVLFISITILQYQHKFMNLIRNTIFEMI